LAKDSLAHAVALKMATDGTAPAVSNVLDRLKRVGMNRKDRPQHQTLMRASVLVPLFFRGDNSNEDSVWVLLTQRPETLRTHAGEVCFPGGKQDAQDECDDVVTALRETHEEVGIDSNHVRPLCRLESVESYTGLCVTPIVGCIDPATLAEPENLKLSENEVEAAFVVPLAYFAHDENLSSKEIVEWRDGTFELRTYHYRSEGGRTFRIWGLTAYIAHQVAMIALNAQMAASSSDAAQLDSASPRPCVCGYLFRLEADTGEKPFWVRRYFVLDGRTLHQYVEELQAKRKESTATKKNRLSLEEVNVRQIDDAHNKGKYEFSIAVLSDRVQWHLAAESQEERDRWIGVLKSL
jgi:8-oxo-dGTP pyrophosphatase MutT (NUDIX family)